MIAPRLDASFTASPTSGQVPLLVAFTNTSVGDYTASVWDFGDASTSTLTNPTHLYATPGTFTVSLTISGVFRTDTVITPSMITVSPLSGPLQNGSFEDGWTDLPPAPGNLINQQPNSWSLEWVEPGQPLYGSGDLAGGVPECVHKLNWQLPPDEQLGGTNALILDGEATYKIFHFGAAFGAQLQQVVVGLTPGTSWRLTAPILLAYDQGTDDYGAESGVWVDGVGGWANFATMGNRSWYYHTVDFTAPPSGQVTVLIRVKSKWPVPADFFIDHIQLVSN